MDIEKWTDKELARLEKRITEQYKQAGEELQEKADKHFGRYQKRLEEEYDNMVNKRYGYAYGDAKQKFKMWQYSYLGRGENWTNLKTEMTDRLTEASIIAVDMTNAILPSVYVNNSNAISNIASAWADKEHITGIRFDLVDENTVRRLMMGSREVRPYKPLDLNIKKLTSYNGGKLQNALLQSILQGETIDQLADRFMKVGFNSRSWAIANARTSVTGARSSGKQDRYDDLASQGVVFTKIWVATNDNRTREEHAEADGQEVPYDEPFDVGGEELMYPADPSGSDWNIINCRCTMRTGKPTFRSNLSDDVGAFANIRIR